MMAFAIVRMGRVPSVISTTRTPWWYWSNDMMASRADVRMRVGLIAPQSARALSTVIAISLVDAGTTSVAWLPFIRYGGIQNRGRLMHDAQQFEAHGEILGDMRSFPSNQEVGVSESQSGKVADSSMLSAVTLIAPIAVTYFIGWAYLHHFLNAFGIGILELDIGLETVLIYAAPALTWFMKSSSFWTWLALVLLLPCAAYLVFPLSLKQRVVTVARDARTLIAGLPATIRNSLVILIAGLFLLLLSNWVQRAATAHAIQRWTQAGVKIQAPASEHGMKTIERENYQTCLERRGLELLIADSASYFMLCPSEIDSTMGAVFEIRRDTSALASARQVFIPRW